MRHFPGTRPALLAMVLAVFAPACSSPAPSRRGALTGIGGTDYESVEGGNTTAIRAASTFGCTDVGAPFSLPANAVVATWGIAAFGVSTGEDSVRAASWFLVGMAPFNTSGKLVQTGACIGDRFLVGSNFGLEWISKKDLTSGTFASTLFNGNGVSALLQTDATHVLAGVLNTTGGTPSGVLVCDLTATTCSQAAAGFSGLNATDSVLAFYRSPSGTILAGTRFSGVWRSTDAGLSWSTANAGLTGANNNIPAFVGSGNNVFIASSGGVYESTTDGQSWTKTSNGLGSGTIFPTSLAGDGTTMYAGLNSGNSDIPGTIWKTTNGAASWQPAGAIPAQFVNSMAVTPGAVWAATNGGVLRSTDAGATWSTFNKGLNNTYVPRIVVSGGTLFAGAFQNSNGFFRSTDGGATWLPANALMNNRRIRAIAISGSSIVASGEESTLGVYRSTDGGVTFALSRAGLPANANAYSLLTVGTTIYAGLIPSGFASSTNGGASWTPAGSGLSATAPVTALASSGGTLLAAAGQAVYRSTDGGATFTPGGALVPSDSNYFITSLAVNGSSLFAGIQGFGIPDTHGLLQSANLGATWTRPQSGIPSNNDVYDIAVAGARILAGTQAGIYASTDGGATWTSVDPDLSSTAVTSVAASGGTIHAGTFGRGLFSIASPEIARRLLPVVLDVDNGFAHYTSEIALANRGTTTSSLTLLYTASLGAGSGTVTESLSPGQQLILPDAIAYLRSKGLSIPASGSQAGTLLITFENLSDAEAGYATARTTAATSAPQPVGAAGLAYVSMDPAHGETTKLRVYGLRSNAADRSNVAVFNTSAVPVTLKVTAFSGAGDGASAVIDVGVTLPPWGWTQYNRILDTPGYSTGWVVVERVSTSGSFGAYGAINNNITNDGSFVPATTPDIRPPYMNVPVLVETPTFRSELDLTNASPNRVTFNLTFFESLASAAARGARTPEASRTVQVVIEARTVMIQSEAVDWLRALGASVGPKDAASYAGIVHIEVAGALINDTHAGARTAAQSPAGGQFGFFSPARLAFDEATSLAYVYGLNADAKNRSNLAMWNTGTTTAAGDITVRADIFDGKLGGTSPALSIDYTLHPGQWKQANDILGQANVQNGYIRLTRTAGTAPFDGYVVTNDGRNPGDRTGDGAWYPISTRLTF